MIARWRLKAHSRRGCKQQVFRRSNCERGLQINDSAAAYQTAINGSGIALGRTTLVALDLATGGRKDIMNTSPGALGPRSRRHWHAGVAITALVPGTLLTGLGVRGFTPLRSV